MNVKRNNTGVYDYMLEAKKMAEDAEDNIMNIECLDKDVLEQFVKMFVDMSNTAAYLERVYQQSVEKANDIVTDLEHLASIYSDSNGRCTIEDMIGNNPLPPELEGIRPEDYAHMLIDVLSKRRQLKDWCNVFRVVKCNTSSVAKFIQGMNKRIYAPSKRRFDDAQEDNNNSSKIMHIPDGEERMAAVK